jgi:hypothetical protein
MKFLKLFSSFKVNENFAQIDKANPYKVLDNYKVVDDHRDYFYGQHNYTAKLYLKSDNKLLATVLYSEYKGKIEIGSIQSHVRGEGYGQILMIYLAKKYGYKNLGRKILTDDGVKMRQRLDDLFDYDYKSNRDSNNKHLDKEILDKISEKHPLAGQILLFFVDYGRSQEDISNIFSQGSQLIEGDGKSDIYNIDNLYEISQWIKDSETNKNDITIETPDSIKKMIDKLL